MAIPLLACSCAILFATPAAAQPPPPSAPAGEAPTATPQPPAAPLGGQAGGDAPPPARNVVEDAQKSIVGVVTIWQEPEDPWAWLTFEPADPAPEAEDKPVMSLCTGWFDSASTITTAGHCVDPAEGRQALDGERMEVDPETGMPIPPPPNRPEPARRVIVFQPRELPGRVIEAPTEVRVHSFRPAEEGDTAKLEIHRAPGMPPGPPLPIAATEPALGTEVVSIGFPGINVGQTDGIDLDALLNGGNPAKILEDSRLQPVSSTGTVTARQYQHGSAVFQTNADVAPGTSGGPVINKSTGEVLGVNSWMTLGFFTQNFNGFTNTGMLREFLGHDTPHQTAAPPPTAPTAAHAPAPADAPGPVASENPPLHSGVPTGWLTGVPILGGAVLGGLLTWLVMIRRPGHRQPAPPMSQPPSPQRRNPPPPQPRQPGVTPRTRAQHNRHRRDRAAAVQGHSQTPSRTAAHPHGPTAPHRDRERPSPRLRPAPQASTNPGSCGTG
jgi:hypothetical protein